MDFKIGLPSGRMIFRSGFLASNRAPSLLFTRGLSRVNQILKADKEIIAAFCARHHVKRLSLFGSQLEGRAGPESDVDFLVQFEAGKEPGLIGLAEMEHELSTLLGGRTVDLRTPGDLSRYFRDEVIRSSEVQYER